MFDTYTRKYISRPIIAISKKLVALNINANQVSVIGFFIAFVGATLYYFNVINYSLLIFIWLSGLFDVLDGQVANLTVKTKLGSFIDIVLDRIVEFMLLFTIAYRVNDYFYFFVLFGVFFISISVFLTSGIINTNTTSNKSFHYSVGITERTETFIFISLLVLFIDYYKFIIIGFIILVFLTIIQRTVEVFKYFGKNVK